MSEYEQKNTGLSTGIKSMLIILGLMLAIIIFLIWAGIIRDASSVAGGGSFTGPDRVVTDTGSDDESEENPDPVGQAREPVVSMVEAPACENPGSAADILSEFVTVSTTQGGLTEDDERLIVDTLNKIDDECSKDYSLELDSLIVGAGTATELARISNEADWVSPARPAPEDAESVSHFTTADYNIHCTIEPMRAACSIYTYSFPSIPQSCESYTQTLLVQETTESDGLCTWRLQSDNPVEPGAYANDTFACDVSDSGVECWSQLSGKGFEVSREESRLF